MPIVRIRGDNFVTKGEDSIQVFNCIGIRKKGRWIISTGNKKIIIKPLNPSMLKKIEEKTSPMDKMIWLLPHQAVALFLEGVIKSVDFRKSLEYEGEIILTSIEIAGQKRSVLIKNNKSLR